jgi:hypothetical protein
LVSFYGDEGEYSIHKLIDLACDIAFVEDLSIEDTTFFKKLFYYVEVISFTEETIYLSYVWMLDC